MSRQYDAERRQEDVDAGLMPRQHPWTTGHIPSRQYVPPVVRVCRMLKIDGTSECERCKIQRPNTFCNCKVRP